jgi:hypothetical protein
VMADFTAFPFNAMSTINRDETHNGVFVNPLWDQIVPKHWQLGILAHEVGHLSLHHASGKGKFLLGYPTKEANGEESRSIEEVSKRSTPEQRKALRKYMQGQEFEADAWAARFGYGESLIASLEDDDELEIATIGGRKYRYGSITHPSPAARVRRLRKGLMELSEAA